LTDKYDKLCSLPSETYLKLCGKLKKLPATMKIKSCSYSEIEFEIHDYSILAEVDKDKPIVLVDANNIDEISQSKNKKYVFLDTKLNNRSFELRTPLNNCIFKMNSLITNTFRNFLIDKNFIEIQTPKLIGTASEGGSHVFKLDYFGKKAYLAQSPQLYKQMLINADFEKVFEIGPVFRAEESNTTRHLCEFTGLDVEMEIPEEQTYGYVIDILWQMLDSIFTTLKNKTEEYNYIKSITNFTDLVYPTEPRIIHFCDAVELLNLHDFKQNELEDLSTQNEKQLGIMMKKIYDTDLFVIDQYPTNVRPFYTMPFNENLDSKYSNSYDVIMRGEEISSGAQRIHKYSLLMDSLNKKKLDPDNFKAYIESFAYGSKKHGGYGLGLNRILMLFFELKDVRRATLFPRDPTRITP